MNEDVLLIGQRLFNIFSEGKIKAISEGSSNPRFDYKDESGLLQVSGLCIWFYPSRRINSEFHTSYISKINLENNILTLFTRNSAYMFKIDQEHNLLDGILFELSREEISIIEDTIN